MTTTKMRVTGEYVTGMVRRAWTENNIELSTTTLVEDFGLTEEQAINVCIGKARIVGDNIDGMFYEEARDA